MKSVVRVAWIVVVVLCHRSKVEFLITALSARPHVRDQRRIVIGACRSNDPKDTQPRIIPSDDYYKIIPQPSLQS